MKKFMFIVITCILASCSQESHNPEDTNSLYSDNGKIVSGRYKDCGCTSIVVTDKYYYKDNKVTRHIFEFTTKDTSTDLKTYYQQMKDDDFYKSVTFQEPNTVIVDCYFDEMTADSVRKICKTMTEECNPVYTPM
ncbi:MAG: hypothetical protein MJ204_04720 [Bacteroidales bacterium]|nr:hypothetical protein [Bacteroidales bacterium]MCQ2607619.1 hypothetical protein [Bacteroidales bacterium]